MYNSAVKFLDETAARHDCCIAIDDGDDLISYARYRDEALSIATSLLNSLDSVGKCRPVVVFLPKSYRTVVAFMGILYSGNTYVPIDVNMPSARLAKIFANLNPHYVITDVASVGKLDGLGLEGKQVLFYDDLLSSEPDRAAVDSAISRVVDTDPIYIMYTSGSTGNPKGVVIPHGGVIDYARWVVERFEMDETTVLGNQSPFYFDNTVLDIYATLLSGGTMVIIPEVFFQFQSKLPEYLNEKKINFVFWVPTVMINVANSGILEETSLHHLRKALFCGEVMPNKQLNIWRQTQPHVFYANLYGPTEITDVCTYFIVDREFADHEPLPIGIPCENMDVVILTDGDKSARVGETGELCVLGTGLALGYWAAPEITEKVFMQNPLNKNYFERMYRTGDLAYRTEEGLIMYVGRKDSQIKHRGNRIELGEIETAAKSIENIQNACVLYDEKNEGIVMFLEIGEEMNLQGIKRRMLSLLPKYMLPGKIIKMDKLPYNANGKIDRVKLRADL